ncbi:RPA family protein [Haladaptatus sp. NG-WS-4]
MREVAQRAFAREFNDATYTFRESDDDRAPVYALLPTGAKANRVFVVGTLTETEDVGSEDEYWQGRIVDPTGTFFVYAGQYQPEAAGMLRDTEPPAFVAVVGKPRTYETDDGTVNVSLRPEHLTIVDEITRDRWVIETAERTLERIDAFDDEANKYGRMARDEYGEMIDIYQQTVIEAVESLESAEDASTDTPHETAEASTDTTQDKNTKQTGATTGDVPVPSETQETSSDSDDDLEEFDPDEFSSESE